jgi:hypothetical protein
MNLVQKLFNIFVKLVLNPKIFWIRINYEIKKIFFDIYFFFIKKYKYNIIFLAGMPMSATTKVKNMCGMIPGYFTRYSPIPYKQAVDQNITNSAFKYTPSWSYTLFKTHLNPNYENLEIIKENGVNKVIVTYRDLRDVALSRYHRLLKFPKNRNDPDFSEYQLMKKTDAINDSIEIVYKYYIKWINGWIDIAKKEKDFVLFIKFEEMIDNPKDEFIRILNFYEINLNEKLIQHICDSTKGKGNMITNMNESKILPWAVSSNFRSGEIGNWKKEFSEENILKAKKLLGESLIKLKYENTLDWKI